MCKGCAKVLSLDLLFQSVCKGVKERQRTASGARWHPDPDLTLPDFSVILQCKTAKHLAVRCCCQFYLIAYFFSET